VVVGGWGVKENICTWRGSNRKMQCADGKINQLLMPWCRKLAMVEVQCVAEKARYPLMSLVKNMQTNRWPFKS
jgi:hypothetical protein